MGILIKQSIQSTFFVYTGAVIGFINTTILFPKFLQESQIGALNLIVSYAIILGFLGTFGFTKAIGKFFPYFRNKQNNHGGFVFLILVVGIAGFLLVSLVFLPVSHWLVERNQVKSPQFAAYIHLIFPLIFVHVFWNLFDTYNTMLYRTTFGISLKEFWLRLIFTLGLVLLIYNYIDFNGYAYVYVGGFVFVFVALVFHLIYFGDFNVLPQFSNYPKSIMRQMFSWSAYGFITGLSGFAALKIDAVMINEFIDDSATGVYVTVFNFATLILMPNRGISRIASTIISDAFKVNDLEKVRDMYKRSCLTLSIVAVFIFLGLITNIHNIFRILPESYSVAYWVVYVIGFANVIRMLSGVSENIISLSSYYRVQTLFMIIYLVSIIGLNYFFIPSYGIIGAAIASALAILIYSSVRYVFLFLKYGFQPYDFRYVYILIFAVLTYYIIFLIPQLEILYLDIFIRGVLVAVLFLLPLYFFKVSEDFNLLTGSVLQSIREYLGKKS